MDSETTRAAYDHLMTLYNGDMDRFWTRINWTSAVQAALITAAGLSVVANPGVSLALSLVGFGSARVLLHLVRRGAWWGGVWRGRLQAIEAEAMGDVFVLRPDRTDDHGTDVFLGPGGREGDGSLVGIVESAAKVMTWAWILGAIYSAVLLATKIVSAI